MKPTTDLEHELWKSGIEFVGGGDEVGVGAFCGPVVAAIVIVNSRILAIEGINDSKKLKPKKREELARQILGAVEFYGIGCIGNDYIDEFGIKQATEEAYFQAYLRCGGHLQYLLLDGKLYMPRIPVNQDVIVRGDEKHVSIAAASIVAKCYRDRCMCELHNEFPVYGFNSNNGYGTAYHREQIAHHGLCKYHRRSYHITNKEENYNGTYRETKVEA